MEKYPEILKHQTHDRRVEKKNQMQINKWIEYGAMYVIYKKTT